MSDTNPALRRLAVGCAFAAAGGLIGLCVMPEPEAHAASPVGLAVAGRKVGSEELEGAARRLATEYLAGSLVLEAGMARREVRLSELGAAVDLTRLGELLVQAADGRSVLRRAHEQLLGERPLELPMPARIDTERALEALLPLKDELDRAPVDAAIDPRKKEVVPSRTGQELDLYATLERIDRALRDGQHRVQLALRAIPARRTVERFEDIAMDAVIGEFSTRYNRSDRAHDRTHNLRVVAQRLDGFVVRPGEVLDFNELVGDRTTLNGFRMAPVIAYGELVDGMGGGTCQIASTLHAAVFFAGLPILTRHPHSRPSYYIKLGLDAAVAYGSLNFRFKNDRPYPVVVGMTVDDGFVRVALYGPERHHTVSLLRRVDETMPFEEKVVQDATLPSGTRVLQQRGIPGFKLTRFRVVLDERTRVAERETSTDVYPATTQIWREGTGGEPAEDFERPPNDPHPEYLADEFLIASQGPDTDGVEVTRTAGRTGTYGWIEREGMAPQ
jgi:vancomycin resistance protein YoaR